MEILQDFIERPTYAVLLVLMILAVVFQFQLIMRLWAERLADTKKALEIIAANTDSNRELNKTVDTYMKLINEFAKK